MNDVRAEGWGLRMRDLCEETGLNRQAIHFYIREGLLPPGRKTGRNTALYGEVHLERLRLVQRLQRERFLPLAAIKALLDGGGEEFDADQRAWLRELKTRVAGTLARGADRAEPVPVASLLDAHGVSEVELAELDALGIIPVGEDADGARVIHPDDAWALEIVGALRALGFTDERGFGAADLAFYERFVSELFTAEAALLSERLTRLTPDVAARMTEQVLPLIHQFITRYHEAKIRRFFAGME